MQKKVIVLSLGGSQIIPDNVNVKYLKEFKKVILKNKKDYKFIVVCGGGSLARKYISAIKGENLNLRFQSLSGISATRTNARFMNYFFGIDPEQGIPHTMDAVKNYIKKMDIIFCGALEYKPDQTSDSTAAEIAKQFKAEFVNLTNVKGLHDKNPKEFKDAKFIPKISWADFNKLANKIKFQPGQHFVLDQTAAKMILKNKTPTYIIESPKELDNLLNGKKFIGTEIEG
ncbi:MAG: UMP kinase [Nanoarchaeota archaeon]|nr:UMP kinase [Nanoarchaeota archaeon]